jgi:hypothetical protein
MKLFAAIAQILEQTVAVVDAVGTAVTTVAVSTNILAQAGQDMAQLAKNTTAQMLKEQELEMQTELILLARELDESVVIDIKPTPVPVPKAVKL